MKNKLVLLKGISPSNFKVGDVILGRNSKEISDLYQQEYIFSANCDNFIKYLIIVNPNVRHYASYIKKTHLGNKNFLEQNYSLYRLSNEEL